jgi:hypothetical protein
VGTYVVQQGGKPAKGGIRWGLNIFLLLITGGLWIFALPWWPRHKVAGGANAAAISSSVINIQAPAPAPAPAAPVVQATVTAQRDPAQELRQLKSLHDEGILTDEEYELRRSALVQQLQAPAAGPAPGALPPPSSN